MTDRPHDRPETTHPAEQTARQAPDDGRVWVPWSEIELPDEPNEPKAHDGADRPSRWDASELTDHPDRPDPENIHLPPERRTHILDGDPNGPGGGHRAGTGRPGKTEFPDRWSDSATVDHISDVAHNPDAAPVQQHNRRWRCQGTRDGVTLTVIVWPEGKIWAAWPQRGGRGVTENLD